MHPEVRSGPTEAAHAMHGLTVVPHDEIVLSPFVNMDKGVTFEELEQLIAGREAFPQKRGSLPVKSSAARRAASTVGNLVAIPAHPERRFHMCA